MRAGVRPEAFFGLGKPNRPWTNRDRALSQGLVFYEQSLNSAGVPSWIAQDPERKFAVDEVVDFALETLESTQEDYQRGGTNQKGLRLVLVDQGRRES
jgi:hypothetical protein